MSRASDRRSSTRIPTPSLNPVPSASAEYALQRPSGASPRSRLNRVKAVGDAMIVTPPARASVHSPLRKACAARWIATSDDEQAVSTVTAGPSKPKLYATRPDTTLIALPVIRWPSDTSDDGGMPTA